MGLGKGTLVIYATTSPATLSMSRDVYRKVTRSEAEEYLAELYASNPMGDDGEGHLAPTFWTVHDDLSGKIGIVIESRAQLRVSYRAKRNYAVVSFEDGKSLYVPRENLTAVEKK